MLDYEYINVLAEILLDETCSEKERKLRFELVKKIQGRAQYYLERGFLPQVVEAFFSEKMEGISKVFTQKDAEDVTIREFCTVSSFPKSRVTCANSWNRLERSIQSSGWTIHTTIGIKYRRLFPAINADILWQAYMRNIRMTSWM